MAAYLDVPANKFEIELEKVMKAPAYALMGVAPSYRYENGRRTDIVDGYRYTVANTKTFDKFDVKTPEPEPIVSAEQIASSEERFFVSFVNAVVKPVKIEYGRLSLSVTADSAKIVRKTN